MAVSNPGTPSLAGDYQNILQQMDKSGTIAQQQGQLKSGTANAIATPLEQATGNIKDIAEKKYLDTFKASLEDQLNQHKETYKAEGEGRIKVTPERYDAFLQDSGMTPEEASAIHLDMYKGAYVKPEEVITHIKTAHREADFAKQVELAAQAVEPTDPQRAAAIRTLGALPGEKLATAPELGKALNPPVKPSGTPKIVADKSSSTGYSYYTIDKEGNTVATGLEAPAPATGGGKSKPIRSTDLNKLTDLQELGTNIQQALDNYDPNFVGPVNGRTTEMGQSLPGASPKAALFLQGTNGLVNTELHKKYGSRLTATEIARYGLEGPSTHKNSADYETRLRQVAENYNKDKNQKTKSLQDAGFEGIPDVPDIVIPTTIGNKEPVEKVAVKGPHGETGKAFKNQKLPEGWHFIAD